VEDQQTEDSQMPLRCVYGADYNHPCGLTSQCCRSPSQVSDPTQSPALFDPIEGEEDYIGSWGLDRLPLH